MSEESWHEARLIPTSGINGAQEQERRATSALLAVLSIVPDYSRSLLGKLGAPAGGLAAYIEVPFELDGSRVYPDGLIRIKGRAGRQWTALVEVKTGKNVLETNQLENYLDVARAEGFDALITISNEIPPTPGQHPTAVDKRKLRKVVMHHLPWSVVLSTAIMQKEHRGVSDPEQAWILGELIRYLEHERSGALDLDDMGSNWVSVRESVLAGTLKANDKAAPEVTSRFDALLRYAGLRLGQQLGTDVNQVLTRAEIADPSIRTTELVKSLASEGVMTGAIRIPHVVGDIVVTADVRAGKLQCHVDVDAPRDGRALTRVNWLLRQLKHAPDDTRIEVFVARSRASTAAELLIHARENPKMLVLDPQKEIKSFRVACSAKAGTKRGRGRGAFIDSVIDLVDEFYGEVLQHLKAWSAAPPKLRQAEEPPELPASLSSTALSSQDGPEPSDPA